MQGVEEKLATLLQKLSLQHPVTVSDIKESIWNANDSNTIFQLFSLLSQQATGTVASDEIMQSLQDAWNSFPHRFLGGKSPHDIALVYQQTGTMDASSQNILPKKGRTVQDLFENHYPEQVTLEKISDDTWGFSFPKAYHDLLDHLREVEETQASSRNYEQELSRVLTIMPELFDAASLLTSLHLKKREYKIAKTLYEQALHTARSYIPHTFLPGRDHLIWAYLENRPFLRLLAGYAQFLDQHESTEQAIPLYEELLALNPGDNLGIRALLATAYLRTDQPEKVVSLADRYPGDLLPDLVMGTVLSLFQLGQRTQAKQLLHKNRERLQRIIAELLKPTHLAPATLVKESMRLGGADEAYDYWQSQGTLWQKTAGALAFLQEETKTSQTHQFMLTNADVTRIDFFADFLRFLTYLTQRPIKRTATGNISVKAIADLLPTLKTVQPLLTHAQQRGWTLRTEQELHPLHMFNILAALMKLTRKNKDTLVLTKNGQTFLQDLPSVQQYTHLLSYYWQKLNWPYISGVTENRSNLASVLQRNQTRIWQRLLQSGTQWIEYQAFCQWLRDTLPLEPFLHEFYATPEHILERAVEHLLFAENLCLFGCVEVEWTKEAQEWKKHIIRFRSTAVGLAMYQEASV
jgi:tetratricopeptide (TPR) repeat protein